MVSWLKIRYNAKNIARETIMSYIEAIFVVVSFRIESQICIS